MRIFSRKCDEFDEAIFSDTMDENTDLVWLMQIARVHGIGNLGMAGSPVFTTGGFANPTLKIICAIYPTRISSERTK